MSTGYGRYAFSLLRIVAGLMFAMHGAQKLLGIPPSPGGGTVPLGSLMGAAGVIELVGGLLVAIGLLTRPAAFIMAGEMAVAYFMVHFQQGPLPINNKGEPAVLYCFLFLLFSAVGAGAYSVDHALEHRAEGVTVGRHRGAPITPSPST